MVTKETVAALFAHGQMVTVKWPGSGELIVGLQRHMIDDAMAEWEKLSADDRGRRMRSVQKAIKRATKRVKNGKATQHDTEELAADIALFIGHELVHADGERWLVKSPTKFDH